MIKRGSRIAHADGCPDPFDDTHTVCQVPQKLGRPRRTKDVATARLTIRLTAAERVLLEHAAGNLPVSDWSRDILLAAAR